MDEVESKYSFTEEADLEWMDMPYTENDFPVLKEYYTDYCTRRFDKIKHLLCNSLGIAYEEIEDTSQEITKKVITPVSEPKQQSKKVNFADKCVLRLAKSLDSELVKVGRSSYVTTDGKHGYVITTSKAYKQGKRDKFWFAYRRNPLEDLKNCEETFVVYGCKDENIMVALPVSLIEEHIERLNNSKDEDGTITHWHIVLFKDTDGTMTWMLSKPEIEEIEISDYMI